MPSPIIKPSKTHGCINHTNEKTSQWLRHHLHQAVRQQNYPKALNLLTYFITQDPTNSTHYSNRGLIYYYCEQWPQAMADYEQAVQLNPNEGRIYTNRAKCRTALGHWSEAIADYDYAIILNPYNIKARIHQGILFRTLKMYDEAIVCFDLALFLGKLSAHIYAERGRTYQLDGHWNCAVCDYQHALTILEQSPEALLSSQIQSWMTELLNSNQ